jgi:diaminopimelate decarboxylase
MLSSRLRKTPAAMCQERMPVAQEPMPSAPVRYRPAPAQPGDETLWVEQVALPSLAEAVATPFYCYSSAALRQAYDSLSRALAPVDAQICFAVKANSNLSVLRMLAQCGAGADVVSGGELSRALRAGIAAERIVFSGVGKTRDELAQAISCGIAHINVESPAELETISRLSTALGRPARILLRVNPGIDARTHAKITTGTAESKFGIPEAMIPALYARAQSLPGIRLQGLAMHIGSQILAAAPFRQAFGRLAQLVRALRMDGLAVSRLDLGGGLGMDYGSDTPPDVAGYAAAIADCLTGLDCRLTVEPGRILVARAGLLLTRVVALKPAPQGCFVIVDAAMNDFMRVALYDAEHRILPVRRRPGAAVAPCHIAGPVCESSDVFARNRPLPPLQPGDLLAICDVGAYGAVLASTYNARPLVPELLVDGGRYAVVRQRQSLEQALSYEPLAPWL